MSSQYRLYLHPNGYFYHRVKVPADIRHLYGKRVEQRSLKTRDFREAVRRLPAVIVEFDEMFSRFRGEHAETIDVYRAIAQVPRIDICRFAVDHGRNADAAEFARRSEAFKVATRDFSAYVDTLSLPDADRDSIARQNAQGDVASALRFAHRAYIEGRLEALSTARAAGDFERWAVIADNLAPGAVVAQRVALIKALMDAEFKALEGWRDLDLAAYPKSETTTRSPVSIGLGSAPDTGSRKDLPLMSQLARECAEAMVKENRWSPKSELMRSAQIEQFIAIVGDKPLNAYTQSDMRRYKAILMDLTPTTHNKVVFKGLTKIQIAAKARELNMPRLSAESVRQNMTSISVVYGWARANYDLTLANLIHPLIPSMSADGNKRDKRQKLEIEDLRKLFQQPIFSGVKSVDDWYSAGNVTMCGSGRFWVPLLGLFSGARLMEACQLLRDDIGCDGDIWFIDINEDEVPLVKRVKNAPSVRRIPIHPQLLSLGFLDFVETIPKGERLFPDLRIGPDTQRHRYASKLFNRLLESAGVKTSRKVWHSLRHSFEQACRDSRVDSAIMDQLQGHAQKGMRGVYGHGYGLPALAAGIQSIQYEGLDLSHIQPFRSNFQPAGGGTEAD